MSFIRNLKNLVIGSAKNPRDRNIFHRLSLIAFFAWVGLGADGLSSSCYGPEEAFLALGHHKYLGVFVAALSAVTVIVISASYSQIIELFPTGGGGYLVASKLLNSNLGMISGCALLIDYVFTIAISIASGADALFSFLPDSWILYKLPFAILGVFALMLLNMRGVKESVVVLTPIFLVFVVTHVFVIVYAFLTHLGQFPDLASSTVADINSARTEMGWAGIIFIILKAYSLGAGTYTGIEAVSNGLPILREPRVETGKLTMRYMANSLAFTVAGLMIAYLIFGVQHEAHKTLNAVLFENLTAHWSPFWGTSFILVILVSEVAILFVAAQAGFLGGPSVLANMALDHWVPTRFSSLSDRLVTQNGVMLMGLAAIITVAATHGSVHLLVVLYSINVFITFCLSQAGMVRHWWSNKARESKWKKKMSVNGLGLLLTTFILISVVVLKFHDGGWITLVITGLLAFLAIAIKRHYKNTLKMLRRLNALLETAVEVIPENKGAKAKLDPKSKTAAVLVNGFNGLGLHTLFAVIKNFGKDYKNFVFIQVGIIDAGNFKGTDEMARLEAQVQKDLNRYVEFMHKNGYYAKSYGAVGTDAVDEIEKLSEVVLKRYPNAVFFGGQLVFLKESLLNRLLHNYTVFALQQRFYQKGTQFVILPIRV